jgi:protoheme IX farnesyltransferase
MLPVARGEVVTRREILAYAVALVALTVAPFATGLFGGLYLAVALALGAGFVGLAAALLVRPSAAAAVRLHLASLAYLALLFCAMAVDRVI